MRLKRIYLPQLVGDLLRASANSDQVAKKEQHQRRRGALEQGTEAGSQVWMRVTKVWSEASFPNSRCAYVNVFQTEYRFVSFLGFLRVDYRQCKSKLVIVRQLYFLFFLPWHLVLISAIRLTLACSLASRRGLEQNVSKDLGNISVHVNKNTTT